jgi:hypothetical protein
MRTVDQSRPCKGRRRRAGVSLLELNQSLAVTSVLLGGVAAALVLASRSVEAIPAPAERASKAAEAAREIAADLMLATSAPLRTADRVQVTVPDRDGDGAPESITYAWRRVSGPPSAPGAPGDPIVRTYNDGPATIVLDAADRFDLSYHTRSVQGWFVDTSVSATPRLLLVVRDVGAPLPDETARQTLVESWGFEVTLIDDDEAAEEFATAASTHDVAYVPSTIAGASLSTKLTVAPIGVVGEEKDTAEWLEVEQKPTRDYDDSAINITDNTHAITRTFATEPLTIFDSTVKLLRQDGALAPGAATLAVKPDDASKGVLVVVDTGGELYDGTLAPARRVVMPWGKNIAFGDLNAAGRFLLQRSLEWAAGIVQVDGAILGYDEAYATPVSSVRWTQIATRATLAESGTLTSIAAYVGGATNSVRYALYADAGGEPGALLVQSGVISTFPADGWRQAFVSPTPLAAGDYWLALAFAHADQRYHHKPGGTVRYRSHNAVASGFLPAWGTSTDSFTIAVSIYGLYTPD